jgi:hypothetical protein
MIINQSEKLIIRNENRYLRIQSSPLARAYDGRPSMRTAMSMSTVRYCSMALLMNDITKTWVTV